jgi:WD40 repeat protein
VQPSDNRIVLHQIEHMLSDKPSEHWKTLVDEVRRVPARDVWLVRMLESNLETITAWEYRKKAKASDREATEAEYRSRMRRASPRLLEAWRLHPELPEAAKKMIEVAMAGAPVAGETPRFWFDEAVAAQFDYMPAYRNLIHSLWPYWGGREELMMEFGLECLATKRFDTEVPAGYRIALDQIGVIHQQGNWAYGDPGVYYAYQADRTHEMKELIDKLGDDLDPDAFGMSPSYVEQLVKDLKKSEAADGDTRHHVSRATFSPKLDILAIGYSNGSIRLEKYSTHEVIGTLQGAADLFRDLVFSADGNTLAALNDGGALTIWDVPNLRKRVTLAGPENQFMSVSLSPDGKVVATLEQAAIEDSPESRAKPAELKLWSAETGELQSRLLGQQPLPRSLAFSPDGRTLASAAKSSAKPEQGITGAVCLWDVPSRTLKTTYDLFADSLFHLTFSSDGKMLIAVGTVPSQGVMRTMTALKLVELSTGTVGKEIRFPLIGIGSISASPDGAMLAVGDQNYSVRLFDLKAGKQLATLVGHNSSVHSVSFAGDSNVLASCTGVGELQFWDVSPAERGQSRTRLSLPRHSQPGRLQQISYSRNGHRFATGGGLGTHVLLWDVATWDNAIVFGEGEMFVPAFAISPDVTTLVTVEGNRSQTNSGAIRLFDIASGRLRRLLEGHRGSAQSVAYSPDGKILATGHMDFLLRLWDSMSGELLASSGEHRGAIVAIAFSEDGRLLATGDWFGIVKLWELPARDQIAALQAAGKGLISTYTFQEHTNEISALDFSPDGNSLAIASLDGGTALMNLADRTVRVYLLGKTATFSPDGKTLATGGGHFLRREIKLWDADTGKEIRTIRPHDADVDSLSFSPDGKRLAAAIGDTGTVKLWDIATGKESWDDTTALPEHAFLTELTPGQVRANLGSVLTETVVVKGTRSAHGVFLHPPSDGSSHVAYRLKKAYRNFEGAVAIKVKKIKGGI